MVRDEKIRLSPAISQLIDATINWLAYCRPVCVNKFGHLVMLVFNSLVAAASRAKDESLKWLN